MLTQENDVEIHAIRSRMPRFSHAGLDEHDYPCHSGRLGCNSGLSPIRRAISSHFQ